LACKKAHISVKIPLLRQFGFSVDPRPAAEGGRRDAALLCRRRPVAVPDFHRWQALWQHSVSGLPNRRPRFLAAATFSACRWRMLVRSFSAAEDSA